MERFNFRKLNVVEVKEQYQVKISTRFASLETWIWWWWCGSQQGFGKYSNIEASATMSLGYYKLKRRKSWFDAQNY